MTYESRFSSVNSGLPLVSVIIPTYNSAKYLHECLESVFQQSYPRIEIIVVDDGSTDNTKELLSGVESRIKHISIQNHGAGVARNFGILAASGKYLAFLDSDDIWHKDKISLQVAALENFNADIVYCGVKEFFQNGSFGRTFHPIYEGHINEVYRRNPTYDPFLGGPGTVLMKTELLARVGIFDPSVPGPSEDWDFFRRACKVSKVKFLEDILLFRRIHDHNISRSSLNKYYLSNRIALAKMFSDVEFRGNSGKLTILIKFYLLMLKSWLNKYLRGHS